MILHGRFGDFYKEWSEENRVLLIEKMELLIREISRYADSKNYGFMCNLPPALAIVQVLEDKGMPRKEA